MHSISNLEFLLQISKLHFSYNEFQIFREFAFQTKTRITLIRGPSGCGKTTLLKLIGGFIKPSKGIIDPYHKAILVLQDDSLLSWFDGYENIERFTGCIPSKLQSHELFPLIENFVNKKTYEMSYGQRRLIELIRALLSQNRLLLWDEPFNFLDSEKRKIIINYILEKETDRQFIISSHYSEYFKSDQISVFDFKPSFPHKKLSLIEGGLL